MPQSRKGRVQKLSFLSVITRIFWLKASLTSDVAVQWLKADMCYVGPKWTVWVTVQNACSMGVLFVCKKSQVSFRGITPQLSENRAHWNLQPMDETLSGKYASKKESNKGVSWNSKTSYWRLSWSCPVRCSFPTEHNSI